MREKLITEQGIIKQKTVLKQEINNNNLICNIFQPFVNQ